MTFKSLGLLIYNHSSGLAYLSFIVDAHVIQIEMEFVVLIFIAFVIVPNLFGSLLCYSSYLSLQIVTLNILLVTTIVIHYRFIFLFLLP